MKRAMDLEQETLLNELTQGRELANQLKIQLDTISSSSPQTCEFLLEKILYSYEKALSMLNWSALVGTQLPPLKITLEASNSLSGISQRSEKVDRDSKDDQTHKDVFKKRKLNLTKWSEQVNICSGTGKGNPIDDGYSWRKYGQKDILGANFPRAYYRCAHRHSQGCLATKQVQKSDEDPSIIEISYKGKHTCIQSCRKELKAEDLAVNFPQPKQEQEVQTKKEEILFNFETEDSAVTSEEIFAQFSFPPTPFGSEIAESEFLGNSCYSPAFISPATPESNYFSLSPCHMNNLGLTQHFQSSDSDFGEIISGPNSVSNSPIGNLDLDLLLDQVDFDSTLPLDILESFS